MVGPILLTLGALSAALALTVETCTQGSADSLYGGFLTLVFYLAGTGGLVAQPPSRKALIGLLPAAGVAVWHSIFTLQFAWGYFADGMSACYAMNGGFSPDKAGEWMDGGEPFLIVLWLSISALSWIALAQGFSRSAQS